MIYFLTESGRTTGLGHLYRSINLSHTLNKQNKIKFLLVDKNIKDNNTSIKILKKNKINYQLLNKKKLLLFLKIKSKNTIVFDLQKTSLKYLDLAKKNFLKSIIIDDENNLKYYDADIIINQNSYAKNLKYKFNNKKIIKLFGANYTILPKESRYKISNKKLNLITKNIFLLFGGTDIKNFYWKISKKLTNYKVHINISNKIISNKVKKLKIYKHIKFHNLKNLNKIVKKEKIDLIISCCGSGLYQLFLLKVPVIGFMCANNQINAYKYYGYKGGIISTNLKRLNNTIKKINLKKRKSCIKQAQKLVNIKGNLNISKIINRELNEYKKN